MLPVLQETLRRVFDQYEKYQCLVQNQRSERIHIAQTLKLTQWQEQFMRNPDAVGVEIDVEQWARRHRIWLENYSPDANTMGSYVHPQTKNRRHLELINQMYTILFYIDDTFSNELLKQLSAEEQRQAQKIIMELLELLNHAYQLEDWNPSAFGVVNASREFLHAMKLETQTTVLGDRWFRNFVASLKDHLTHTAIDQNEFVASLVNESPQPFVDMRNDISGMFVTTSFFEFSTGQYLDWAQLVDPLPQLCKRLDYLAAIIGGFTNELFSFEKEVILHQDSFNMIVVLMLQNPTWGLPTAIFKCIEFLNAAVEEFDEVALKIERLLHLLPPDQQEAARSFVCQARLAAIACLTWQVDTARYEKDDAIFAETDRVWRRETKVAGLLQNGVPLPEDYFQRIWPVYHREH